GPTPREPPRAGDWPGDRPGHGRTAAGPLFPAAGPRWEAALPAAERGRSRRLPAPLADRDAGGDGGLRGDRLPRRVAGPAPPPPRAPGLGALEQPALHTLACRRERQHPAADEPAAPATGGGGGARRWPGLRL